MTANKEHVSLRLESELKNRLKTVSGDKPLSQLLIPWISILPSLLEKLNNDGDLSEEELKEFYTSLRLVPVENCFTTALVSGAE